MPKYQFISEAENRNDVDACIRGDEIRKISDDGKTFSTLYTNEEYYPSYLSPETMQKITDALNGSVQLVEALKAAVVIMEAANYRPSERQAAIDALTLAHAALRRVETP